MVGASGDHAGGGGGRGHAQGRHTSLSSDASPADVTVGRSLGIRVLAAGVLTIGYVTSRGRAAKEECDERPPEP